VEEGREGLGGQQASSSIEEGLTETGPSQSSHSTFKRKERRNRISHEWKIDKIRRNTVKDQTDRGKARGRTLKKGRGLAVLPSIRSGKETISKKYVRSG